MNGFTRQEALRLTGTAPGNASYWDHEGIISPAKIGNPKHPLVVYTPEQVYQLLIVTSLKESFSLQLIRRLLDLDLSVPTKYLVIINGTPTIMKSPADLWHLLAGQIGAPAEVWAIGDFNELLKPLQRVDEILDFDKRISGTVLERLKRDRLLDKAA